MYNKKILIVTEDKGTDKDYRKYYGRYCDLFYVVGIIDLDKINLIENYEYDYILITNFNPSPIENQHCIRNNHILVENLRNNKYKLLAFEVIEVYFNNIKKENYNKNNSKNKFLVIRITHYSMGLGSIAWLVAKGMVYAKEKGILRLLI